MNFDRSSRMHSNFQSISSQMSVNFFLSCFSLSISALRTQISWFNFSTKSLLSCLGPSSMISRWVSTLNLPILMRREFKPASSPLVNDPRVNFCSILAFSSSSSLTVIFSMFFSFLFCGLAWFFISLIASSNFPCLFLILPDNFPISTLRSSKSALSTSMHFLPSSTSFLMSMILTSNLSFNFLISSFFSFLLSLRSLILSCKSWIFFSLAFSSGRCLGFAGTSGISVLQLI